MPLETVIASAMKTSPLVYINLWVLIVIVSTNFTILQYSIVQCVDIFLRYIAHLILWKCESVCDIDITCPNIIKCACIYASMNAYKESIVDA